MPIEFQCECGKAFRVRDEWAGRKASCKVCGRKLTIPGEPASSAPVPPPLPIRPSIDAASSPLPPLAVPPAPPARGVAGFLKDLIRFYADHRRQFWKRFATDHKDAREIELNPNRRYKTVSFDETGWTIGLPEWCLVCGGETDADEIEETHEVPDLTWPLFAPIGGTFGGLVLSWMVGSYWVWPIAIVAGFVVGYANRDAVAVRVRFRRCAKHVGVKSVPRFQVIAPLLRVGVGHRRIADVFEDVNFPNKARPSKHKGEGIPPIRLPVVGHDEELPTASVPPGNKSFEPIPLVDDAPPTPIIHSGTPVSAPPRPSSPAPPTQRDRPHRPASSPPAPSPKSNSPSERPIPLAENVPATPIIHSGATPPPPPAEDLDEIDLLFQEIAELSENRTPPPASLVDRKTASVNSLLRTLWASAWIDNETCAGCGVLFPPGSECGDEFVENGREVAKLFGDLAAAGTASALGDYGLELGKLWEHFDESPLTESASSEELTTRLTGLSKTVLLRPCPKCRQALCGRCWQATAGGEPCPACASGSPSSAPRRAESFTDMVADEAGCVPLERLRRIVAGADPGFPLRTLLAFAVRCARRVVPLYRSAWPTAPANRVKALEQAVEFAERCVALETRIPATIAQAQKQLDSHAAACAAAAEDAARPSNVSRRAAESVRHALLALAHWLQNPEPVAAPEEELFGSGDSELLDELRGCLLSACIDDAARAAILADFQCVSDLAVRGGWTESTVITSDMLGPKEPLPIGTPGIVAALPVTPMGAWLSVTVLGDTSGNAALRAAGCRVRENVRPDSDNMVLIAVSVSDGPTPELERILNAAGGSTVANVGILLNGVENTDPELVQLVAMELRERLRNNFVFDPAYVDALPVIFSHDRNLQDRLQEWERRRGQGVQFYPGRNTSPKSTQATNSASIPTAQISTPPGGLEVIFVFYEKSPTNEHMSVLDYERWVRGALGGLSESVPIQVGTLTYSVITAPSPLIMLHDMGMWWSKHKLGKTKREPDDWQPFLKSLGKSLGIHKVMFDDPQLGRGVVMAVHRLGK